MTHATEAPPLPDSARVPPHDLDAEKACLGSMMMDRTAIDRVLEVISREDSHWFYLPAHEKLFKALCDIHHMNKPMDLVVVQAELRHREILEDVGGQAYLIRLAESFAEWANAEHYAELVAQAGHRRDLIGCGAAIQSSAYDQTQEVSTIQQRALESISATTQGARIRGTVLPLQDHVAAFSEKLNRGEAQYIPTGIEPLDAAIGGVELGALTIIGARPSVGKTSLAWQLCVEAAKAGTPALFISAEMRAEQLLMRFMRAHSNETTEQIRDGIRCEEWRAGELVLSDLNGGTLLVTDRLNRLPDILAECRIQIRKHEVKLIAIDYLQLLELGARAENQNLRIAAMSKAFKALALDTGVAVLLLTQLNRKPAVDNRQPTLADLRDSGAIEQDADQVWLLHGDQKSEADTDRDVMLFVAKNRNGPKGRFSLVFNAPTTTFRATGRM